MAKPWFRLYSEFAADPKVQLLAFEDQRHFVLLLCLKCNGTLDTASIGPEHFERMICKALGLDPTAGAEAKRRLIEVGLITQSWQPVAWDRRQFESDSSTPRVRAFQARQREAKQGETFSKRSLNALDQSRTYQNISEQIQSRSEQNRAEATTFKLIKTRGISNILIIAKNARLGIFLGNYSFSSMDFNRPRRGGF